MPLYEYECGQCGCFERIQKFSDPVLTVCPTCGQEVQKLLSSPAIQFKGSGWYITDYARKNETGKTGGDKEAAKADTSKSSSDSSSSSPQTSTSKDSSASGSSSSK
ncbi:MAG TPA: FmdB family zinc ribbon protein [Vicinamibacteria bacterium]